MKRDWRKWTPWLALCVSLGVHSIGVMLPVLKPPLPPEIPETELPEPIAVVSLPTQDQSILSSSQKLTAPPVPVVEEKPVLVEPEFTEPELVEAAPIKPEFTEPEFTGPESTEPEFVEPEATNDPAPQVFDATNTDPADTNSYIAFSEILQSLNDSIIPHNIRNVRYGLNYLGDLCFTGEPSLNGTLAVAVDSSPTLTTGKIITSTGYGAINQAIERWFAQLQSGQIGGTDELASTTGVTLFDWIQQAEGEWFLNGEAYEAYFFNITVNLVNNPCIEDLE